MTISLFCVRQLLQLWLHYGGDPNNLLTHIWVIYQDGVPIYASYREQPTVNCIRVISKYYRNCNQLRHPSWKIYLVKDDQHTYRLENWCRLFVLAYPRTVCTFTMKPLIH